MHFMRIKSRWQALEPTVSIYHVLRCQQLRAPFQPLTEALAIGARHDQHFIFLARVAFVKRGASVVSAALRLSGAERAIPAAYRGFRDLRIIFLPAWRLSNPQLHLLQIMGDLDDSFNERSLINTTPQEPAIHLLPFASLTQTTLQKACRRACKSSSGSKKYLSTRLC
jgi:hypothetical protein